MLTVLALGNEGFLLTHEELHIVFDPLSEESVSAAHEACNALLLVTHDHWDHFDPDIAAEALRKGMTVIGPQPVASALRGRQGRGSIVELEPDAIGSRRETEVAGVRVTAFRTVHGWAHNSYLVEFHGFRVFHDGDNERTDVLPREPLSNLDALMLCPWQGSGWLDFVESVKPRHWFIMHLTDDEFEQYDRGEFFEDVCPPGAKVPRCLAVLRPGESSIVKRRP